MNRRRRGLTSILGRTAYLRVRSTHQLGCAAAKAPVPARRLANSSDGRPAAAGTSLEIERALPVGAALVKRLANPGLLEAGRDWVKAPRKGRTRD